VLFPVIDLATWVRGEWEPGGDEEKRWFSAPEGAGYRGHWLFKPRREKELVLAKSRRDRGDSPDLLVRGEDWAEKISYEVARMISIPSAVTELATTVRRRDGQRVTGSMSRDIRPLHWQLSPGASLLAEYDDAFDADSCQGHSLFAIREVLQGADGPPGTYESWSAFDVFAGYLVLDAWIANTDRHPHNWAVLQAPGGAVSLAPSFDHGSALASGDGDARRARNLTLGVDQWCERGMAARFETARSLTLVELAEQALQLASGDARRHWREQISQVDDGLCEDIVARIPDLSDSTRTFISEVLVINRRRLCDAT
jgi:hypothetical protein